MRVAIVDGLVTLYYDGSKELWNRELHNEWQNRELHRQWREHRRNIGHVEEDDTEAMDLSDECKRYLKERLSWQQVIIVDSVTEIPEGTFYCCDKIKRVIFADTVIRIHQYAFMGCKDLVFIKLSFNLEYIGRCAFQNCNLSSVFIPPRCREIGHNVFSHNENLTIFNVSQDVELGDGVVRGSKLHRSFLNAESEDIKTWIKNINHQFDLHRVCSSFEPTLQMIVDTMEAKGGPNAFKVENSIGITPSKYLKENPYANVKEKDIIEKYIRHMMGEKF